MYRMYRSHRREQAQLANLFSGDYLGHPEKLLRSLGVIVNLAPRF